LVWLFWLLQGQGGGGLGEFEGAALVCGGLREHGQVGGGAGEADLVAGEGGQVGEQAAEAAVRAAVLVVLAGGFGRGVAGALGGGDRVGPLRWVFVGEGR
jgi:hypothetical protein